MTEIYFFHSSESQKFMIKVLIGLVSGEASLPDLQMVTFSLCHQMVFTLVFLPLLIGTPVLLCQSLI